MPRDLPPARAATAWRFMTYILSKPVQDRMGAAGRALPARRESMAAFIGGSGDPRRRHFVDALPYSRMQPLFPRFGEVDRVVNDYVGQLLDPNRPIGADEMLSALSQDPVILSCFPGPGRSGE